MRVNMKHLFHLSVFVGILILIFVSPTAHAESINLDEVDAIDDLFVEQTASFVRGKKYSVYSAPSENSLRSANGKAAVSTNGEITVYGSEADWLFIQYEIDQDQFRFGYIQSPDMFSNQEIRTLEYSNIIAWITREVEVTDDPLHSQIGISVLYPNQQVKVLGILDSWAYIMCDEMNFRGFIPMSSLRVIPKDISSDIHTRLPEASIVDFHIISDNITITHALVLLEDINGRELLCYQQDIANWNILFSTRKGIPQSNSVASIATCVQGDSFEYGAGPFKRIYTSDGLNFSICLYGDESLEEFVMYSWLDDNYHLLRYSTISNGVVDIIDDHLVFSGDGFLDSKKASFETSIFDVDFSSLPPVIN